MRVEKEEFAEPEGKVVGTKGRAYAKVPGRKAARFCTWRGLFAHR